MNKNPEKSPWKHIQIGLELAVSVLIGFFAGHYADKKLGTSPWLLLLGCAIGMISGFYLVLREVLNDNGK